MKNGLRVIVGLLLAALSASADQAIVVDGQTARKRFDGVGAVSGGGATSVLLKDYPEPQRGQILDLLFKPNFAASMSTLYVEVPGDGNSTQGTEPSHMRSRDDLNYHRGYEWWIMVEAKKRNPLITLDACAWSAPGWIGEGDFWSQDMADYYVSWIKGLKDVHGLELDAVGCRNERGDNLAWVKLFRKTLNANGFSSVRIHAFDNPGPHKWEWCGKLADDEELRNSIDIIGNHTLTEIPTPDAVKELSERFGKPIWNTEEHIYNEAWRKFDDEYACALGAVHDFNDNFIRSGATKIVNWHLVGSTYKIEPYAEQPPAMFANSPWSGHYRIKPIIWAYAHYGQFVRVGWQYVQSACAELSDGGSCVALKSAENDYSVIVETSGAARTQELSFKISGGLSLANLCVWRSNRQQQFVRLDDIVPDDGTFTIAVEPDSIYSISTLRGQQKGSFPDVPEAKPFPFPYHETYDHYTHPKAWGYLPHYSADICGVFEVVDRPRGEGKCLKQVLNRKSQSWAPEWMPYTVIGDENWTDYEVSAEVQPEYGGWAGVMGRVSRTGNGWDGNPDGYYVRLYQDGGCALYRADARIKGSRDRQLAVASVPNWRLRGWHEVKLRFEGSKITALVDGVEVLSVEDKAFTHGMAGLICSGEGNSRHTALFDNLIINTVRGEKPSPTVFSEQLQPIYKP